MSVRINGLDTHYMYRDVVDIVEQAGERLDLITVSYTHLTLPTTAIV